jgi:hypothetical protein
VNYPFFAIAGLIALGFSFSYAYAHTTIEVGPYEIEVGWQNEPPVVGILNALTIDIRYAHRNAFNISRLSNVYGYSIQDAYNSRLILPSYFYLVRAYFNGCMSICIRKTESQSNQSGNGKKWIIHDLQNVCMCYYLY